MSRTGAPLQEEDRILPEDARFAGELLISAALMDVVDQLKEISGRLERLTEVVKERESRTWLIRVRR